KLLLKAPDLLRCFKAHRQSPSLLAFLQSTPEVRSLPSASITRLPRSYGPVRLPSGRHQVWRSRWRTSPDRASPDNPHCLTSVLCPLPRRTRTGALTGFLPRSAPPSPLPRRGRLHIATFEACSGFNMLRPTGSLSRPRRPLSQGFGPLLSRPPVSYSIKPATIEVEPSSTGNTRLRGALGKGAGTASPDDTISRAPCPRVTERDASRKTAWARRTMDLTVGSGRASAFAHPTIPAQMPRADSS